MDARKVVFDGLTGWALRLGFVSSMGLAAYGVYVAWYGSLGEPDPDHDRAVGSVLMGVALVASFVFFLAICRTPSVRRTARLGWYGFAYSSFFAVGLTALAISAGFRLIGDWERSTLSVTATASGCYTESNGNAMRAGDVCTFDWDVGGVHHTQTRASYSGLYDNGAQVPLWVDPHTGGASDHNGDFVVAAFVAAFFSLAFWLPALFLGQGMSEEAKGWRRWLADLAWWRALRPVPQDAGSPADAVEPVIEDAVPPGWADVEDARPT